MRASKYGYTWPRPCATHTASTQSHNRESTTAEGVPPKCPLVTVQLAGRLEYGGAPLVPVWPVGVRRWGSNQPPTAAEQDARIGHGCGECRGFRHCHSTLL
ncbi:hypothetical protein MTO96_024215 [Rhipicephalus appendiculatus]